MQASVLSLLAGLLLVSIASANYWPAPVQNGRVDGGSAAVFNGNARTYAVYTNGALSEVGVELDQAALESLGGGTEASLFNIPFPAGLPWSYMGLWWNPIGHEPENVYTLPHFDFHFYYSREGQINLIGLDAESQRKGNLTPVAGSIPASYIPTGLVPQMGVHWVDVLSSEFTGQNFTKTFIYGSYNGKVNFLEPMITLAYLQSVNSFDAAISQPSVYPNDEDPFPQNYGGVNESGWYRIYLNNFVIVADVEAPTTTTSTTTASTTQTTTPTTTTTSTAKHTTVKYTTTKSTTKAATTARYTTSKATTTTKKYTTRRTTAATTTTTTTKKYTTTTTKKYTTASTTKKYTTASTTKKYTTASTTKKYTTAATTKKYTTATTTTTTKKSTTRRATTTTTTTKAYTTRRTTTASYTTKRY